MKTAGIICEFNPFHKGHKYLIDSVRQDLEPDAVVCIMSGNFVQRGMPALWDKRERAKAAINGGADLVIQMPVCVSLSSAEYFAKGAVDIAKAMDIDYLCFGSESGDIVYLTDLANNGINEIEYGNNILACEYIRNLDGNIKPYTLKINDDLGHASDIRNDSVISFDNELFKLVQYAILSSDTEILKRAPEVSEGLENRIVSVIKDAEDLNDLILKIKSKRYTYTRISRILMQILLGIEKSVPDSTYAHILAFNGVGQELLSSLKKSENITLYSNISREDTEKRNDLALDVKSDDIYSIITGRSIYEFSDYVCKPYKCNV